MNWQKFVLTVVIILSTLVSINANAERGYTTYLHNDLLGSPTFATDASGSIIWAENYRPYGEKLINSPASSDNDIWFTGQLHDDESGLTYMGARYYDPYIGRFMAMDPAGFDINEVESFNRYAYANNNPYKYVDPNGESPIDIIFLGADLIKLGAALYSGNPAAISDSLLDVAASTVGLISPIPGTGQVIKVGRAADKINDTAKSIDNLSDVSGVAKTVGPKAGSVGGDGAKKAFSTKVKDQARKESNDTCVFCGTKTTREPGPTRSEIDHSIPKSRGGNNTIENAQNTCRTCNRSKSAKTTEEFLNH